MIDSFFEQTACLSHFYINTVIINFVPEFLDEVKSNFKIYNLISFEYRIVSTVFIYNLQNKKRSEVPNRRALKINYLLYFFLKMAVPARPAPDRHNNAIPRNT